MSAEPPSSARNFETLNALRGIAALTVLVWHYPPLAAAGQGRYWAAYLAVDLFFLLSGAVIAHAYEARLRAGWRFHRFLLARIIRLWPLYLLGTAIGAGAILSAAAYDGAAPWQYKPLLADAVRALFLWPKVEAGAVMFPYNPPAWSLLCELVVNIGYGAFGYRLGNRGLAIVALAGLAATIAGGLVFLWLGDGLNLGALGGQGWIGLARASFGFPIGVLLYRAWAANRLPAFNLPPFLIVLLYLMALFALPTSPAMRLASALVLVAVVWPLLVAAGLRVEPTGWRLRVARGTAEISYALYALHDAFYIASGMIAARSDGSPWLIHGVAALAAVGFAVLAARHFDPPVRKVLTQLTKLPRGAAVAAPTL